MRLSSSWISDLCCRIVQHSQYNSRNVDFDFALLRLQNGLNLPTMSNVRPACLPTANPIDNEDVSKLKSTSRIVVFNHIILTGHHLRLGDPDLRRQPAHSAAEGTYNCFFIPIFQCLILSDITSGHGPSGVAEHVQQRPGLRRQDHQPDVLRGHLAGRRKGLVSGGPTSLANRYYRRLIKLIMPSQGRLRRPRRHPERRQPLRGGRRHVLGRGLRRPEQARRIRKDHL